MKEKTKTLIGAGLFVLFTVMFIYGCTTPEVSLVRHKAVSICLECIGIG